MNEDHKIRCQDCMTLLDGWGECPDEECERETQEEKTDTACPDHHGLTVWTGPWFAVGPR